MQTLKDVLQLSLTRHQVNLLINHLSNDLSVLERRVKNTKLTKHHAYKLTKTSSTTALSEMYQNCYNVLQEHYNKLHLEYKQKVNLQQVLKRSRKTSDNPEVKEVAVTTKPSEYKVLCQGEKPEENAPFINSYDGRVIKLVANNSSTCRQCMYDKNSDGCDKSPSCPCGHFEPVV